ncbi:MAG: hypothetical protein QW520_06825 [Methanomassiliicoccales archaeon]
MAYRSKIKTQLINESSNERQTEIKDGEVRIDCRDCSGPQDLKEQMCMRCCLKSFQEASNCEKIILSRYIDVAYEGPSIEIIIELSEIAQLCRMPIGVENHLCKNCSSRPSLIFGELADSIPFSLTGKNNLKSVRQANEKCYNCVNRINDHLSHINSRLKTIEKKVQKRAFMVIED